MTSSAPALATPFRLFEVRLTKRTVLSPTFVRFTFTGPELDRFADNGLDQRIKLLFPAGDGFATLMRSPDDWYTAWRGLADEERPPMRTYTIRAVRPHENEIDVDIVLHGLVGIASTWASTAPVGSPLIVCGPNADFDAFHGGVDFHPSARTARILLAGDETALPAIANILERLPTDARGCAIVEVPDAGDAAALPSHPGFDVIVAARPSGGSHGDALIPLVQEHAARLLDRAGGTATSGTAGGPAGALSELEDVDIDEGILWEVPNDESGDDVPVYAWLAGEAGVIKALRRHLVSERGIDRRSVAFMGYWRLGKNEQN
ncbi:MAG: siderophore-interacting protein [Herbiconiux sp.]|uniref:siderophore-interacting protein n=1 Tax=Herbiconiux sp. TaxID=1871186 RepID=UPI00121C895E|nr:siderophore-interacting protein [Herbiconiux sp.]TAJ47121.1 MAG: siderophore-interacting protein [Herbiconiux sp.]